MEHCVIQIEGMHCQGCVKTVTSRLEGLEGVAKVAVSLEDKNATIEFDPAKVTVERLVETVAQAGFDAVC